MIEFFIDKRGNENAVEENDSDEYMCSENDGDDDRKSNEDRSLFDELKDDFQKKETKPKNKKDSVVDLEDSYITINYTKNTNKEPFFSNTDEILKNSAIKPGFEKLHALPSRKSQRALKLEKKMLREKTKGKKWFDIPATEITDEIKNDMQLLKMRSVLDSKHVYKKNNFTKVPKYFQVGTVIEGSADFYSGRIAKSQRKKTIVEELLADAECKNFQRKKFKEIINMKHKKKKHSKHISQKRDKNTKKKKSKK